MFQNWYKKQCCVCFKNPPSTPKKQPFGFFKKTLVLVEQGLTYNTYELSIFVSDIALKTYFHQSYRNIVFVLLVISTFVSCVPPSGYVYLANADVIAV